MCNMLLPLLAIQAMEEPIIAFLNASYQNRITRQAIQHISQSSKSPYA